MALFDFFKKKKINEKEQVEHDICQLKEARDGIVNVQQQDMSVGLIASMHNHFYALDVETTGLSPENDRIIELGVVYFENGKPINRFSSLIKPTFPIPSTATAVNHITNEMVSTAPSEKDVFSSFASFVGDAICGKIVFCAHNASFDFSF